MKCIFCKNKATDVTNSRPSKHGEVVWRRRSCGSCKEVFTTQESFSYDSLFVIKRNLSRKRFIYEKLFASVFDALSGGKDHDMGDSALKAKRLSQDIIDDLLGIRSKYISSKEIIIATYKALHKENSFFATKYSMYSEYRMDTVKKLLK